MKNNILNKFTDRYGTVPSIYGFGVTYAEDCPGVVAKFAELHTLGEYPENLFEK